MFQLRFILLSFLIVLASACAHYPMGVDEKTWKTLPPEKRAELLKEEARLRHQERLAELRAREAEARAMALAEKARLEQMQALYSRLRYGQVIQVSFSQGEGYFYRYRPIVPNAFVLTIGSVKRLTLQSPRGDNLEVWAAYAPGKLLLCSSKPESLDRFDPRACAIAVDHYWERGESRIITVPRPWNRKKPLLRKVRIFIKYLPVADAGHRHRWR